MSSRNLRNITVAEGRLVAALQEEFKPAELAAIYAHLQGATETQGPKKMCRLIEAAFGDDFQAIDAAMDEAGV